MTEPLKRTTPAQPAQQPQPAKQAGQKPKEGPSIGKLLVNRAGAVVLTPVAAGAGVLTLAGSFLNGVFNPNATLNESMTKGCQAAGQGADMLDKMWQGKFF